MGRSELREHIFRILFRVEFYEAQELPEQLELYFGMLEEISEQDRTYIKEKYEKIAAETEMLDGLINVHATGWKTARMNKVDLTILRLAIYEMKEDEDIPTGVAINEAVELAKRYSSEEGPSFVNGILGRIAKEV